MIVSNTPARIKCSHDSAVCTPTYLRLVVSTRLHRALRVTDLLQHAPTVLQVLREQLLLLRDFRQQHAELVADVADSVVLRALAPLAQLTCDRLRLTARRLVRADLVVLRLDELVQLL